MVTTRAVEAGEELFLSYGPSYWVGGAPRRPSAPEQSPTAAERRSASSAMLDADYWESRCGSRATKLLAQAREKTRLAEEGLATQHAELLADLEAGLGGAVECVLEMMAGEELEEYE